MAPEHAARMLLMYRGRRGKVRQLENLYKKLDALEDYPSSASSGFPGGHGGGLASDPTARDAVHNIDNIHETEDAIDVLERQINAVRDALNMCPHGDCLAAYYVTSQDDVTWASLAEDAKVDQRTILRHRKEGLTWMGEHACLWTMI